MKKRFWPAAALAASLLLVSHAAAADDSADALFQEGLAQMKGADFEGACPKLERSFALEARSGTLISLAFCMDKLGKRGRAWFHYRRAARLARQEGRPDYVEKATQLAGALEAKLAPLRVVSPTTPGLAVAVDDLTIDPSMGELYVDVGRHVIRAEAAEHEKLQLEIDVPAEGSAITIPPLTRAEVAKAQPRPEPPPPTEPPPSSSATLTIVGAVLVGTGGAALVGSFAMGGLVLADKATVEDECDAAARTCSQAGLDAAERGGDLAIGSSVLFAIGLAAAGAGATVLIVDATKSGTEPRVSLSLGATPVVGGAALTMGGAF